MKKINNSNKQLKFQRNLNLKRLNERQDGEIIKQQRMISKSIKQGGTEKNITQKKIIM